MEVKLLSIKDVAACLNVTVQTVLRLIDNGELRASKIGHQWRVHPEDLEALLGRPLGSASPQPQAPNPSAKPSPVLGGDSKPLLGPDGRPVMEKGPDGYFVLGLDGKPILGPDGKVLNPELGPDGKPKVRPDGTVIYYDPNERF